MDTLLKHGDTVAYRGFAHVYCGEVFGKAVVRRININNRKRVLALPELVPTDQLTYVCSAHHRAFEVVCGVGGEKNTGIALEAMLGAIFRAEFGGSSGVTLRHPSDYRRVRYQSHREYILVGTLLDDPVAPKVDIIYSVGDDKVFTMHTGSREDLGQYIEPVTEDEVVKSLTNDSYLSRVALARRIREWGIETGAA